MNPHAQNKTEYFRSLGYRHTDEIFVLDGKIVCENVKNMFHGLEWHFACEMLRSFGYAHGEKQQLTPNQKSL